MRLHPRGLLPLLTERLERRPVVVLTGARQTGKSTLVRDLLPQGRGPETAYISLDDPDERIRLAGDPVRRLDHGARLVILDEVQKQPGLLDAVKHLADTAARRFLLLGSSQILLMKQVRETLAGRASLLELWPLALAERVFGERVPATLLDRVCERGAAALSAAEAASVSGETGRRMRGLAESQFQWGGYPAIEPLTEEDKLIWMRDFRRTYLERDLSDLGRVSDLDQFALGQNLLAARTGQLLSLSEVSRELGVAVNTVKRYVRFLEISYQVYLLRPLLPKIEARLVKSPKLYWTDPGLARLLSERSHAGNGALFETAILCELLRWGSWQRVPPGLHFHAAHGAGEVDFILRTPHRTLALEAKAGRSIHSSDVRSLRSFLDLIASSGSGDKGRALGIVVYQGREVAQVENGIWAAPAWRLFAPEVE